MNLRRREFIAFLGGAAVTWPSAARAQQATMPVIGYLYNGSPEASANYLTAFRKGLSEIGYVEGRNVAIEYRWAQNEYDRLPELAADLIRRGVAVIVTPRSGTAALAAKAATSTIPIVFSTEGDPVQAGLVASLNRPGGNLTGVSYMNAELGAKQLGLLHELLPTTARVAIINNPHNPYTESMTTTLQAAAAAIDLQIEFFAASTNRDIDTAFASLVQKRADALLVLPSPLFLDRRVQLVVLAARHAMPAIFPLREDVDAGALMSYGSSATDQFRQVGIYAGRILRGEKPADLPVMRSTKFEFVVNLQTARTLGITVPPALLAGADEVIE
jgi:putative ABC transport system substrate-binding protein